MALFHYPAHYKTPFENTVILDKKKKMIHGKGMRTQHLVDPESGEVTGHTQLVEYKDVDKEQFFKMYTKNIKLFFELTKAEMATFLYIASIANKDKDVIRLDINKASKFTGNAYLTVNKAICKLIENKIIAKTDIQSLYYINTAIFFNGSRVTFSKKIETQDKISSAEIGNEGIKSLKE